MVGGADKAAFKRGGLPPKRGNIPPVQPHYSPITGFERTYIFDVGFYELTGSAMSGFLLNGIVFFAGILLLKLLVLFRWEKERI